MAGTTFDGRDRDLNLTLDGDVLTGTVGVDGEWDRWLAGLAVAHSRGNGGYTMADLADRGHGELETALTSLHPYLRYAVTDRLDVWGLLGYGWGQLELEPGTGETFETDTNLMMGAFGSRGIVLAAGRDRGLSTGHAHGRHAHADHLGRGADRRREAGRVGRGRAPAARDPGRLPGRDVGRRPESDADAWKWACGMTGGDAETGFGLELGGRIQYTDPGLGLTIEGAVRGLLAHEDRDYEEWGASGTLRLAPGVAGHGLSLTVSPTWGAAASGVDGLWTRPTTAGLAPPGTGPAPTGQLAADVGYGLPAPFGTGLLTPYAGTVLAEGQTRTYRVGTRLHLTGGSATGLTLNLEGQRQEPSGRQPATQGVRLQVEWGF